MKRQTQKNSSSICGSPLMILAVYMADITCAASPLLQTILWLWKIPRKLSSRISNPVSSRISRSAASS